MVFTLSRTAARPTPMQQRQQHAPTAGGGMRLRPQPETATIIVTLFGSKGQRQEVRLRRGQPLPELLEALRKSGLADGGPGEATLHRVVRMPGQQNATTDRLLSMMDLRDGDMLVVKLQRPAPPLQQAAAPTQPQRHVQPQPRQQWQQPPLQPQTQTQAPGRGLQPPPRKQLQAHHVQQQQPRGGAAPLPVPHYGCQSPRPRMCRALHGWDAASGASPGDLLFEPGAVFRLVSDTEPGHGWWMGSHDGFVKILFKDSLQRISVKKGIFPSNYVELIEPEPEPAPVPAPVMPAPRPALTPALAPALVDDDPWRPLEAGWHRRFSRRDGAPYFISPDGESSFDHPGYLDPDPAAVSCDPAVAAVCAMGFEAAEAARALAACDRDIERAIQMLLTPEPEPEPVSRSRSRSRSRPPQRWRP